MAVEKSMKESLETVKDVVSEKKLEASPEAFEDAEMFKGKTRPSLLKSPTDRKYFRICGNTWKQGRPLDSIYSQTS